MKIGKVPESVLKRSILKTINVKRDEILLGAGVGEDCAMIKLAPDESFVLSTDPITAAKDELGTLAMQITLNDLASSGAEPVGVLLCVLLPESIEEADIKEFMAQIQAVCEKHQVQVMGGHTEVTKVVNQPVLTVTGVGKVKDGQIISTAGARAGMDIVVTKWIGIEGTVIMATEKEQELSQRFSTSFLKEAQQLKQYLSVVEDSQVAVKTGVSAMHDVTEGGIFGALWEMAEASGVGLEIDLKSIPIRQETIEICEFFHINPYELISSGSMLMASEDGNALVRELAKAGIAASIVGKATPGNDRVLLNDGERRFLEPPKTDELYKVIV